jgi:A/G-specific adenine glycosylase
MVAILPTDIPAAAIVNAATMELGATVCTARAPRCEACPLSDRCRWRAEGYPDTGDTRRKQARYEGSDRQARGAVLRMLRDAAPSPVPLDAIIADWPDPLQRDRAIDSLVADGLAEASDGLLHLPR